MTSNMTTKENDDCNSAPDSLKFIDKRNHIQITGDKLPHWEQANRVQFVTFRLADSLPQTKLQEFTDNKRVWLEHHPKPWDEATQQEYDSFANAMEKWIDAGYGSCVLQYPKVRAVMTDTLLHFDSDRYYLHAFVIMPNHVHVLLTPRNENLTQDIVGSWKKFSAREVNKVLEREGTVWERDSFDRMIRSKMDYDKKLRYIINNPKELPSGTYTLFVK